MHSHSCKSSKKHTKNKFTHKLFVNEMLKCTVCVSGEPGVGKTSSMASLALNWTDNKGNISVLLHQCLLMFSLSMNGTNKLKLEISI